MTSRDRNARDESTNHSLSPHSLDPQPRPFLEGVQVLELTCALAGPYTSAILSDLGATVVKVEPLAGDPLRRRKMGPNQSSIAFDLVHRNKKSVTVDLKQPGGVEIVRRLARQSDIFIENFRVGAVQGLGLGYDALKESCPDLVYCSISGFGQTGALKSRKVLDIVAQAYGGLLSVTGTDSSNLAKAGFPVADLGAAMWSAIGVLAALIRARSGYGGAFIDVSLTDSIASWSLWELADYLSTENVPEPLGTAHRLAAPCQAFACLDGELLVIAVVDSQWPRLCEVLNLPSLPSDDRYSDDYTRFRNRVSLADRLSETFATRGRDHWVERLSEAGIPCGPVNRVDDVLDDDHFAARGLFVRDEAQFGQPILINTPIVSEGAPGIRSRAPGAGADTGGVLQQIGYSSHEIQELALNGVVSNIRANL